MNEWSFFVQMLGTNLGKCEWDWEEKLLWLNPRWWNSSWQNSRWLPSSSWVRMNEWIFICAKWMNPRWQSYWWLPPSSWVRMNEWSFFCANGGNQSWQVWVRLRGKTIMAESKMVEFKLAEFKMAAIIKLSQNEWVNFYLCKMDESNMARIQYGCHHHIESESMSEVSFVQNGWIQDGCLHQYESEWMTLSQIELVGVRGISKMAESKMAEFKMAQYKMAAIIKLSENEWVWVRLN